LSPAHRLSRIASENERNQEDYCAICAIIL
jgi:hypothetical protein